MNAIIDLLIFLKLMEPRTVAFDDRVRAELEDTRHAILLRERQLEDAQAELAALRKRVARLGRYLGKKALIEEVTPFVARRPMRG